MRRKLLALGILALVAGMTLVAWQVTTLTAQQPHRTARDADAEARATLPLSHVVLFSSGVGYFQREGTVEGDTRVDMTFRVSDINDLLKSLVLQDLNSGRVSAVSYDSQEPVEKTLKSFALDLTYNPTLGQLLNQARGEKIELTLQQTAQGQPAVLTGVIMGMEAKPTPHGKDQIVETDLLNLLCAEGVRTVPLTQVQRLRFLNPTIDAELRQALGVLSASHDSLKKAVSLNFKGEGRRNVRVGYVTENPMWKASYRLVLNSPNRKAPLLQGWALVENTTDEDWSDVKMSLVSGRPISYQMDLYQPLFVPRPTVEPERFASLRPPTYNAALGDNNNDPANPPINPGMPGVGGFGGAMGIQGMNFGQMNAPFVNRYQVNPMAQFGNMGGQLGMFGNLGAFGNQGGQFGLQGGALGQQGGQQMAGNTMNNLSNSGRLNWDQLQQRRREQQANAKQVGSTIAALDPAGGVSSVASAEEIGDFFQYSIEDKVTLARQKSAMLPIVNKDVEISRVSIFNESVHARFPLLGVRFKNNSGLNLMQGPVTVYEGGSYSGDARLPDLQPGEMRLLSYAVDQGSEVKTVQDAAPDQLTSVKVVKGVLQASHKLRTTKTYKVVNRSTHDRTFIVEHPVRDDWKLVEPAKAKEQSRDFYRFELELAAGKSGQLKVVEEQVRQTQFALANTNEASLVVFLKAPQTTAKTREALQQAMDMRGQLAEIKRELVQVDAELKTLTEDQARFRENLNRLPSDSAPYKRYVEKIDKHETEIEKYQEQRKKLLEQDKEKQKTYEAFLVNLTVE